MQSGARSLGRYADAAPPAMTGLRRTILGGFGTLLLLTLLIGVVGMVLLQRYAGTVQRIQRENYDSVVYGQTIKEALERLTSAVTSAAARHQPPDAHELDRGSAALTHSLDAELHNITVPGEAEACATLVTSWHELEGRLAALRAPGASSPSAQDERLVAQLAADAAQAAQRVIDLNIGEIVSANGRIRRSARSSEALLGGLLGAALALAVVFTAVFTAAILRPLRQLARSARDIGKGHLDLVVTVPTSPPGDELGELSTAFNVMAEQLRETRRSERLRLVRAQHTTLLALDALPDAVVTCTAGGDVDLANRTAQRLFHVRPGMRLADVDLPKLRELAQAALASGRPHHPSDFTELLPVHDDRERCFLAHALPILEQDGQTVGVTLVLADVTDLRRLDEMKSNLLAVVSHELKTPLTGVRMAAHLLLDERTGELTTAQADLAVSIRDEASRMQDIIDGLLRLSRLEGGHDLLELQPCTVASLVEEVRAHHRTAFHDKGVQLLTAIDPDLPRVLVDRTRLLLVFANLLANALRFTPPGGSVTIGASREDEQVVFRVVDTGPGIPEAFHQRVFERFFRVPGQPADGAGLGLAIAKEIVLAHQGRIWIAAGGAGTDIRFSLPLAPAAAPVAVTPVATPTIGTLRADTPAARSTPSAPASTLPPAPPPPAADAP